MRFTDRGIAELNTKGERYEVWEDGHTGLGLRVGTTGRNRALRRYSAAWRAPPVSGSSAAVVLDMPKDSSVFTPALNFS